VSFDERVVKLTPSKDTFDAAADLAGAMSALGQYDKFMQSFKTPCLSIMLPMLRAVLATNARPTVAVQTCVAGKDGKITVAWRAKKTEALHQVAQDQMRIFAAEVEKRVFSKLHDRDFVALFLDPSIDAVKVLDGTDNYMAARAVFVKAWVKVERELDLDSNASTEVTRICQQGEGEKHKPDAPPDIFDTMTKTFGATCPADTRDDATGPMSRLQEFESLRGSKSLEKYKTLNGRFDLLKFMTAVGNKHPIAKLLCKRFCIDLPSEGVSESTFSTHAGFATDLRTCTRPWVVSAMVFCKRNHAYFFDKIKHLIWARYMKKHPSKYAGAT
jgi:hypothetical protein